MEFDRFSSSVSLTVVFYNAMGSLGSSMDDTLPNQATATFLLAWLPKHCAAIQPVDQDRHHRTRAAIFVKRSYFAESESTCLTYPGGLTIFITPKTQTQQHPGLDSPSARTSKLRNNCTTSFLFAPQRRLYHQFLLSQRIFQPGFAVFIGGHVVREARDEFMMDDEHTCINSSINPNSRLKLIHVL